MLSQFTLTDIQRLPQHTRVIDGKEQTGPLLRSVLESAGVRSFQSVTVAGKSQGRLTSRELRLSETQVTDLAMLDFNKQGQVKLVSPAIAQERWVIDVTELLVE
jgi:hypothetical protein